MRPEHEILATVFAWDHEEEEIPVDIDVDQDSAGVSDVTLAFALLADESKRALLRLEPSKARAFAAVLLVAAKRADHLNGVT
jgi:hypothetical protein